MSALQIFSQQLQTRPDPLLVNELMIEIRQKLTNLHTEMNFIKRHHTRLTTIMRTWPAPFAMNRERMHVYYQQQSCQNTPQILHLELQFIIKDIEKIMVEILEKPPIEVLI